VRLGDLLMRALNEHPVVSVVLLLAVLGAFYSAAKIIKGDK
jgi:hypothetical protein